MANTRMAIPLLPQRLWFRRGLDPSVNAPELDHNNNFPFLAA